MQFLNLLKQISSWLFFHVNASNNCNFCKTRNPCSWLKFDNQGDESRDVLGISGTWQETDPKGAMYQAKVTIQDYNLLCNNKKCIK